MMIEGLAETLALCSSTRGGAALGYGRDSGRMDEVCSDDVSCPALLLRGLVTVISRGWVAVPKLGGWDERDSV